jgi:hypothetical protein
MRHAWFDKGFSMKLRFLLDTLLGASILFMPSFASASVVFSNFGPGFGYDISDGNPIGNFLDGNDYAEGDTFSPISNATFTSLEIALNCVFDCPATDNFTISLTTSSADAPDTVLESFSVPGSALGSLGMDNTPLTFDSVLFPSLTAGTQYWITVKSGLSDSIAWSWNTEGDLSDQSISTDEGSTWFSPSGQTTGAYEVDGTQVTAAPEPGSASLLLWGAALCGFVVWSHTRRRRSGCR